MSFCNDDMSVDDDAYWQKICVIHVSGYVQVSTLTYQADLYKIISIKPQPQGKLKNGKQNICFNYMLVKLIYS